jgi:diacylglycerol kinase family enzyme
LVHPPGRRGPAREHAAFLTQQTASLVRDRVVLPPLLDLRLELDGDVHDCRAPFVFIGNNDYRMEGFNIGTRARLDGGCLNVYTTRACSAGGLVKLLLHALFGRLRQAEDFVESRASSLRVTSRKPRLLVATDGEVSTMDTPLEFRIRRRALEVMAP